MWKRLSRLWKKADLVAERVHGEMRLRREAEVQAAEASEVVAAPEPIADPLVHELERFDREYQACGAEGVVVLLRELVHAAPTDTRVLRRAAAACRDLGDEELALGFEQAATTSSGEPLAELAHAFLGMDDAPLALALGDGAVARGLERARRASGGGRRAARGEEASDGDGGLAAGRLVGALALSRLGEHGQVLERLAPLVDRGGGAGGDPGDDLTALTAAVRWALAALALGDAGALARVEGRLGPAETWVAAVHARIAAFPPASEGFSSDPQRLLFALYGATLLDDVEEGERLEPERLTRWMMALATLVGETLPPGTRPAWVSARGEVLARWLGTLLPTEGAMPLSARLPKQPVIVVLADDADLALLVESRAYGEGPLPIFQALKDPSEIGSPLADVVGVFRADVRLPLEELEADKAADRVPPRVLVGRLQDDARKSGAAVAELEGFLAWARARAPYLTLGEPPTAEARIPLDVARDF